MGSRRSSDERPLRLPAGAAAKPPPPPPRWAESGPSFRRLPPRPRSPAPSIRSTTSAFPDFVDMSTETARNIRIRYKDTAKHVIWKECRLSSSFGLRSEQQRKFSRELSAPSRLTRHASANGVAAFRPPPQVSSDASLRSKVSEMRTEDLKRASEDLEDEPVITHL